MFRLPSVAGLTIDEVLECCEQGDGVTNLDGHVSRNKRLKL